MPANERNSPGNGPAARGELEFVRRLHTLLAPPTSAAAHPSDTVAPAVGFGDDMGLLDPALPLLWTVDMLMDGVDFDSRVHPWEAIGRKAMAVNLSDCAAMATIPVSALCAVSLANALTMDDALDLLRGAQACGLQFNCPIVGGDTNSWDAPTAISIAIAARCEAGRMPVRRDGARPGDRLWLTGPVGGSLLGRHMTFEPRIETALEINRRLHPHAMIDISDGLALDLARLLTASVCGAILNEEALAAAIHPDATRRAAQDNLSPREHALYDGEDFELIVVLPPSVPTGDCESLGLLPLGRVTDQTGVFIEDPAGGREPLPIRGWEHFR